MNSIRNRLLAVLLAVGVIPVVATIIVTAGITQSELDDSQKQKVSGVTREVARQVKMLMVSASKDLAALQSNRLVTGEFTPTAERLAEMKRIVDAYEVFGDISLYDPDASLVASTSPDNPEASDPSAWFGKAVKERRPVISRPHRFPGQPGLHLKVYMPLKIGGQPGLSVLRARLKFKPVDDLISGVQIGEEGGSLLVDPRGDVIAGGNGFEDSEAYGQLAHSVNDGQLEGLISHRGTRTYYHGHVIDGGATKVDEPWVVLSLQPRSEMTEPIRTAIFHQALVSVLVIVGAAAVGVMIAKKFSAPVVQASKAAKRVSHGDLSARITADGAVELRQLAVSFNEMVAEVGRSRSELEEMVESRTQKLTVSQRNLENTFAQLKASYEATEGGILVVGTSGQIIASNERIVDYFALEGAIETFGVDEFRDQAAACFSDSDTFCKTWDNINHDAGKVAEGEWELVNPSERVLSVYSAPVVNAHGERIARLWSFQDVTEKRTLQRSLEQAQKMEAVGRLAGGVAHDFNNLLTGILGNLSLLDLGEGIADRKQAEYLHKAKNAGQRATALVKQLLGFSRQTHLELEFCDANEVIGDVEGLLTSTFDPRVQIVTDLTDELWTVEVDPTQVEQVVMNLCVNAKDAMEDSGGRISLVTRNVTIDASELALRHPGGQPGDYVLLEVADDGEGIPAELIDKIFDPFFTTKEQGKGTGLGLATSYGIVDQHGGWMQCDSEPGIGTTFSIFLPRKDRPVSLRATRRPVVDEPARGGSETILLVDDDIAVRAVAHEVLKRLGYKVVIAGDGEEALETFAEKADEIDLVLLDLTMPKLSGKETLAALREGYGDVPVVVCSGYLVDLEGFEQETGYRPDAAVSKPYKLEELGRRIRSVLDSAATLAS